VIIDAITKSPNHVSAEEVYAEVQKKFQSTNIATVYRTLELLWEEGLICRNDLSEGTIVYSPLAHGPHIHLVCRHCGSVFETDAENLTTIKELIREKFSFNADLDHISIFGLCNDCRNKK
jgi:Fur family ferric uptake transcriptional regulator